MYGQLIFVASARIIQQEKKIVFVRKGFGTTVHSHTKK